MSKDGNVLNGRPTLSVMSLKEFTDLVAPRLEQNEELFALSLADASSEFLGNDIGDLLKGERILTSSSLEVIFKTIRSGALGRSDLLSSDVVQAVVNFVESALSAVGRSSRRSSDTGSTIAEALDGLNDTERQRLDEIIEGLTKRSMQKAIDRLSGVDRLL